MRSEATEFGSQQILDRKVCFRDRAAIVFHCRLYPRQEVLESQPTGDIRAVDGDGQVLGVAHTLAHSD